MIISWSAVLAVMLSLSYLFVGTFLRGIRLKILKDMLEQEQLQSIAEEQGDTGDTYVVSFGEYHSGQPAWKAVLEVLTAPVGYLYTFSITPEPEEEYLEDEEEDYDEFE